MPGGGALASGAFDFSPDGKQFISGSQIMAGGRQVHTLIGHTDEVNSVAFSPKGNRVVSGSDDNSVKIWDTETGAEVSSHAACTW